MRVIYFLLLIFSSLSAFSQNDTTLTFQEVVKADSIKANELFNRARMWVNDNFKSGKEVIQINDKETGTLTGKANLKISYSYKFYGETSGETDYSFTFKILVKDEKYKYEFTNFENVNGFIGAIDSRIGILTSKKDCPLKWTGWPQRAMNEIWDSSKKSLEIKMSQLTNSLKAIMLSRQSLNEF